MGVLLGAAHDLLDTNEEAGQHCCFCYLPVLLNSAAGWETAVGSDPSGAVATAVVSAEAGSSLLLHLLLPEASVVS